MVNDKAEVLMIKTEQQMGLPTKKTRTRNPQIKNTFCDIIFGHTFILLVTFHLDLR